MPGNVKSDINVRVKPSGRTDAMRIGELSERTGVAVRMLRYYEQRGLLAPRRSTNGYREYGEADVERAGLVSSLIRSGLPTKLIIPLLRDEVVGSPGDLAELTRLLAAESERLEHRIACMTLSRTTIEGYLARLRPDESVAS
jgi:DNA-binding transcriptional MerR regulator